jgi:serine phosphatase RsbU (regulator of sigma subunit)
MDTAARRFARRILLVHVALLVLVLALVLLALREVYRSTRDEVIAQAQSRQELLTSQTARGIEGHYQSILNTLDLMRRAENEESSPTPATIVGGGPATAPAEPAPVPDRAAANAARAALFGPILWKQLQGRVSLLVSLDRTQLAHAMPIIRIIGSDGSLNSPEQLITQYRQWLENIDRPSVSDFQILGGEGGGANLVCVPFPHVPEALVPRGNPAGAGGPGEEPSPGGRLGARLGQRPLGQQPPPGSRDSFRLLIAVVPIREVEALFLKSLNDDPSSGAWLIDDRMTAMAASRPQLVGANMADIADPEIRNLATDYIRNGKSGSMIIPRPFNIGSAKFIPAMVSAEPIHVGDKTWELFIATSVSGVDGIVYQLFHRAVLWGFFVIIAITAILVSTAIQMIRTRVRLERVRHDILNRELTQARQIQLAWLPVHGPAQKAVDIAAINSPASHISGDFYNWFELNDGRLVVTIGDVTGHGMSAAFLMATTQLLVRNTMTRVADPGEGLTEVNRQLCVQVFNGQFVTMLIMVIDLANGMLQLATAGHPAPLLADGESFQPLPLEPQLVLGVERGATYVTQTHPLPPSASLLLYTDGVSDCLGQSGKRFGTDGLQRTLYGRYDNAQAILDRLIASIEQFRSGTELTDDLTLVAMQLQTTPAAVQTAAAEV